MKLKKPKEESQYLILDMDDRSLWDMTAEEKEEYCQKNLGKSYDKFINDAFFDYTPEEREQIKRDWEYPKPKPE